MYLFLSLSLFYNCNFERSCLYQLHRMWTKWYHVIHCISFTPALYALNSVKLSEQWKEVPNCWWVRWKTLSVTTYGIGLCISILGKGYLWITPFWDDSMCTGKFVYQTFTHLEQQGVNPGLNQDPTRVWCKVSASLKLKCSYMKLWNQLIFTLRLQPVQVLLPPWNRGQPPSSRSKSI